MRFIPRSFLFLITLTLGAVQASDVREAVAGSLSLEQQRFLGSLASMQASSLQEMEDASGPERIREDLQRLWSQSPFALSLRAPDLSGPADLIRTAVSEMQGVEVLGELQQNIPVPVLLRTARLEASSVELPLSPFWPNGALPNLMPADGLTGRLVDIGDGTWEDLRGKDPRGAIVVMSYQGGRNWNRAFALGAQAVLVVEDSSVSRPLAERFFANTPLPFPRFLVGEEHRASLEDLNGETVTLHGGNAFANRTARSVFTWIPPHEHLELVVGEQDLLERIAANFGVQARDLMEENGRDLSSLNAGDTLDIPGREKPYTVEEQDLLKRISKEMDVEVAELLRLNPQVDPALPVGSRLIVPPLKDPLVFLVRMDSVSSLPGEPHGASAAFNTLAGLRILEQAVAMPEGHRRRGVLVAFLEGDNHGGRATRALVETWLDLNGQLEEALVAEGDTRSVEERISTYQEIVEWWSASEGDLEPEAAEWLAEEWLAQRLEGYRVQIAEARVGVIQQKMELEDPADPQVETLLSKRKELEEQQQRLVRFRKETLDNDGISQEERIRGFLDGLEVELLPLEGIEPPRKEALLSQLQSELDEEQSFQNLDELNRVTTGKVLETLYPEGGRALSADRPLLAYWVDLSDGSPHLSLEEPEDFRGVGTIKRKVHQTLWTRLDKVVAYASLEAGWKTDWNFIGPGVDALFSLQPRRAPASYKEFWAELGIGLLDLRTVNDNRLRHDTQLDIPQTLNLDHLSTQLRTLLLISRVSMESREDGSLSGRLPPKPFSRVLGQVSQFNVRSGIDAQDPVPGSLVVIPSYPKNLTPELGAHNSSTYFGTRTAMMQFCRLSGHYKMPVEILSYRGDNRIHAYLPDVETGLFDYVMEGGQIGTKKQNREFAYLEGRDTWKTLVLYPMYPLTVSPGVEPLQYAPLKPNQLPQIQDAVLKGTPRHVQVEHPMVHYREVELDGMIVYMEPGRRMVLLDKRAGNIRGLLLGELDPDDETSLSGQGIPVGPLEENRNLVLPLASLEIAQSLQAVNDRREAIYTRFGIRDTVLFEALALSRMKLEEAEQWKEKMDWQRAIGASRESWGLLIKNYPGMLRLGREAVLSVVLLMALMAPTSVFLERLLIGSKHILSRLGFAVLLFGLGTIFLNFFHPAFMIAASPVIVVIAYTMILMAAVVLGICYQRFEVLVRRARIEGGEAESEEISLASTLSTAFNLGVSNLKKRPTRTFLTAFTVTVLTFSIVSFVSVKGTDTLFLRPVPLDLRINGVEQPVEEIESPAYEGAMFRQYSWGSVSGNFMDAVETEFGSRFPLARRFHYIEQAGGNNATQEGTNQIEIRNAEGTKAIVTALMGFEAAEKEFSGLNRAVSGNTWFSEEDRNHIILPNRVAEALAITDADLLNAEGTRKPEDALPKVQMMSQTWTVVGILDAATADRIRDVNGKSLALVDYLRSAITPSTGEGRLETEEDLVHMDWEDLAIVPVNARRQVDGVWNSLALRFPEEFDFDTFRDELAKRTDRAMFAYVDGNLSLLSARKVNSVGGLAKVLVPIVLCVLIVSNTMMGTVDERVSEVQMLGAIGLSPPQISFLLMAESTVFSCIGILFGTFSGLIFSQVAGLFPDSLGQLSFNFTSLASTFLAMGTGGVVLLATLLPARRASALAAPSGMDKWKLPEPGPDGNIEFVLPFTLTRGNAVGMGAFFRRFLLNHVDSSSADFMSKGNELKRIDDTEGLTLQARMWLAPYDLDVAQDLTLDIEPTGHEGVFGVTIRLHRISGTEDAWLRTNYGFLNLVRKQFLLWRNLEPEMRHKNIGEGARILENPSANTVSSL